MHASSQPITQIRLSPLIILALVVLSSLSTASAQTLNILYSFTSNNVGDEPFSGLVMDQAGRLYGTNVFGGAHDLGTVYRVTHTGSGWIATGLYSFEGGSQGYEPTSNVSIGPDGTLCGTTSEGGFGSGFGTVFNLRPPAAICRTALCPWQETVLYRFTGEGDGAFGGASYADTLVFDQAGNIYGTTPSGGAHGAGVVFKLTRSGQSWTESVLWSFTGQGDGGNPASGVTFDSAGNLYGTALNGGTHNLGIVYELSPSGSGWTQRTLYSFGSEDGGGSPFGGVTIDTEGNVYGTTGGESAPGEAYELTQSDGTWAVSRRQVFTGQAGPFDTPTLDAHGNLYGTNSTAGPYGAGEVFELTPSGNGWTYTHLYQFTGSPNNGGFPIGGVILDSTGNLYGTTSEGGQDQGGIVWEITQ